MTEHPLARWKALVRDKNLDELDDLLDEQAVYLSPVLQAPQLGRALAKLHLSVTIKLFFSPEFRYVREIVDQHAAALEFQANFKGIDLRGADVITWNDEGRITEFKVLLGPLAAANMVKEEISRLLTRMKRGET